MNLTVQPEAVSISSPHTLHLAIESAPLQEQSGGGPADAVFERLCQHMLGEMEGIVAVLQHLVVHGARCGADVLLAHDVDHRVHAHRIAARHRKNLNLHILLVVEAGVPISAYINESHPM